MSPRPGGETDKLGNRYELAWAIRHALYCINDDRRSITLEDIDKDLNKGSEFTYVSGVTEVHQLKRQDGNSNFWSVKALAGLKIFTAAAEHVAAGRDYYFVSLIPCGPLRELAERARQSANLASFTQSWLTVELRPTFDQLAADKILGSPQKAWETLRGMWFEVHAENDIVRINDMLAELTLAGANGRLAALAIGDILLNNLGKRLTRDGLLAELAKQDLRPLEAGSHQTAHAQVSMVTASWTSTIQRELLQPPIERDEVAQLTEGLDATRLSLIVGTAGGGKSAVLEQTVTALKTSGAEVLALRLDRLEPFASTVDLGRQLGLATSPAAALAMAADGRAAYLVIDQVDAVSLASGRMPQSFDVVMDLIGEALSVAGVRVILACREFDVENDYRIRELAGRPDMKKVQVGSLPIEAVQAAIKRMGLDPARLTGKQLAILQTPLHLVLLNTIAGQDDALSFQSRGSLFEAFWERKRQAAKAKRAAVRFNDVLSRIANAASDRQALSVPIEVLDADDLIDDAHILVSENVLARDGNRIAFFHESFFDYAFARQWVSRRESLVNFLLRDEQELFRRGQVRQILQHLREREPDRFIEEAEAVLTSSDIRFHIKETALAILANLADPTPDEGGLVLRIAATKPRFEELLWQRLRRPAWFMRFEQDGLISTWLDGTNDELKTRAVELMGSGVKEHGEVVAGLLGARQAAPEYLNWLRWVLRFADVHDSRALFDLLLAAVRDGGLDQTEDVLWLTVHDLAQQQPRWAVELLQARLIDHVNALALDSSGKIAALSLHEYEATELVRVASATEPLLFAQTIVPYLRDVMAATASPQRDGQPIRDKHFSLRMSEHDLAERDLDDALLWATVRALEQLAKSSPDEIRPILEALADDPYDTSQFLLYRGLIAGAATFADWAAELLLQGAGRLNCGYVSDSDWVARELMRAIAPHVSDEVHLKLEAMVRDLRNSYERRQSAGWSAFTFLSALQEDRLSPDGKRRLGEYRRKFHQDEPPQPRGITGGVIGSPIGDDAASKMTDTQWLRAMAKHNSANHDWDSFKGGASELSRVLKAHVAADPARFAQLALQMTPDLNPAYGDAILMGFGDAAADADPTSIFTAIQHIASLGHADNDRWLGMALQRYYRDVPLDLVKLVLDRALHSADPTDNQPVLIGNEEVGQRANQLRINGINTARGSLAEALGDLLVYDVDGQRTELVRPHLQVLASDPALCVRACVAHTIAASLRFARPAALAAFQQLIDAADVLLATDLMQRLMLYIGDVNPEVVEPLIQRMLTSADDEAREAGGQLAAFAGLEWDRLELMAQALAADAPVRKGAAEVCAGRVDHTSNSKLATASLMQLMNDEDDDVRQAAAEVAPHLREQALTPYATLLDALIDSPAYEHATPQLLLTLQRAPDKVDNLILKAAQRFLSVYGPEAADIRTSAAGNAHYISELVVRGLAQSRDRAHRAALLDVLDRLLELGVYGIGAAIADFERL